MALFCDLGIPLLQESSESSVDGWTRFFTDAPVVGHIAHESSQKFLQDGPPR